MVETASGVVTNATTGSPTGRSTNIRPLIGIEYGRGGREHQGAMAVVMDDSAKEGTRRDDPKSQMFVGGTSDFEFETGAKTIHKYDHVPKAREAGTSVAKAGAKTAASVHADAMDAMHEHSIDNQIM